MAIISKITQFINGIAKQFDLLNNILNAGGSGYCNPLVAKIAGETITVAAQPFSNQTMVAINCGATVSLLVTLTRISL